MAIVAIPIMILNFLSGIVGGIWLGVLGYWYVILIGLGLTVAGTFLVSLLLMPGMLFIAPMLGNERLAQSKFAMIPLTFCSVFYTYCVMGIWAIGIYWYFAQNVGPNAVVPVVLWSYSTATAVWSYMAQKEAQTGNDYSTLSAFFHQIGCIALMIYTYNNFRDPNLSEMAVWFAIPMVISLFVQVAFMASMIKAREPN